MADLIRPGRFDDRAEITGQSVGLFTEVQHGSRVVVSVTGELDLATAPLLQRRVCELLCLPIELLTIDMGGVTFMDSSGLAVLIQLRGEARDRDVPFELATVPPCAQRVFEITDTDRLFDFR